VCGDRLPDRHHLILAQPLALEEAAGRVRAALQRAPQEHAPGMVEQQRRSDVLYELGGFTRDRAVGEGDPGNRRARRGHAGIVCRPPGLRETMT
jgi:hypothetical protein